MSEYELLLEEPLTSSVIYRKFKKGFNFYILFTIFIFLISFFDKTANPIFLLTDGFASFLLLSLSVGFAMLSIVYVFSLSIEEIVDLFNFKKYMDIDVVKSKTRVYLESTLLKGWRMWVYPTISTLLLVVAALYSGMDEIPFIHISLNTMVMLTIYVSSLYPLKFVYERYKGMFLKELMDAAKNIQISCDIIDEEIEKIQATQKPLNASAVEINILNIRENTRESNEVGDYFKENMNPPTIVGFIRFIIPATIGVVFSEIVQLFI